MNRRRLIFFIDPPPAFLAGDPTIPNRTPARTFLR